MLKKICIIPYTHGVGGPVSFRNKITAATEARGIEVTNHLNDLPYDAILLTSGTRNLLGLFKAKRLGIPIIQRLDGVNWTHRVKNTGWRHFLRAEINNLVVAFIRHFLATEIIYQSDFSKQWWEREFGPTRQKHHKVLNAVYLDTFSPEGSQNRPDDIHRILLVEGSLGEGFEIGVDVAVQLAEELGNQYSIPVELMIVGKVPSTVITKWNQKTTIPIEWAGIVPNENIPNLDRSAHLFFSAEFNAACPNAVIEALACGLPVVAYHTGSLPELVDGDAGRVVPYSGDVWKLEMPSIAPLAKASAEILNNQAKFRAAARERAQALFNVDDMASGYLDVLANAKKNNP